MSFAYKIIVPAETVSIIQSALRLKIATQMISSEKRLVLESKSSTWIIKSKAIELFLRQRTLAGVSLYKGIAKCTKDYDSDIPFDYAVYTNVELDRNKLDTVVQVPVDAVCKLQEYYKYPFEDISCGFIVEKQQISLNTEPLTFENLHETVYFVLYSDELTNNEIKLLEFVRMVLLTKNVHVEHFENLYIVHNKLRDEIIKLYSKLTKQKISIDNDTDVASLKKYFVGGAVINSESTWLQENLNKTGTCALLKLDGYRNLLLIVQNKMFTIDNRFNVLSYSEQYTDTIPKLTGKLTLLDGEFYNGSFYAFDVLYTDSRDVRKQPLTNRFETLRKVLTKYPDLSMNEPVFNTDNISETDVKGLTEFEPAIDILGFWKSMTDTESDIFIFNGELSLEDNISIIETNLINIYNSIVPSSIKMKKFDSAEMLNKIKTVDIDSTQFYTLIDKYDLYTRVLQLTYREKDCIDGKCKDKDIQDCLKIFNPIWDAIAIDIDTMDSELLGKYGITGILQMLKHYLVSNVIPNSENSNHIVWDDYSYSVLSEHCKDSFKYLYRTMYLTAQKDNDGIIFMDSSKEYPTVLDRDNYPWNSCQKWKPMKSLTVDLKTSFNPKYFKTNSDNRRYVVAKLFCGQDSEVSRSTLILNNFNQTLPIAENNDTILPDSIVEYRVIPISSDDTTAFKYIPERVRYDKANPNGYKTVESVKTSVVNFINVIE